MTIARLSCHIGDAKRLTVLAEPRKREVRARFHARLADLAEHSGETQGWLAARFNQRTGEAVTSATIGRWINGHREPTLDDIAALAAVLGVRAGWLAFGPEGGEETHRAGEDVSPERRREIAAQLRALKKRQAEEDERRAGGE